MRLHREIALLSKEYRACVVAYYTSITARALAIELSVASAYLEDELAVLEKYDLITKSPVGKYQTKLVIFTENFTNEFHRKTKEYAGPAFVEIIFGMGGKLEQIRLFPEKYQSRRSRCF